MEYFRKAIALDPYDANAYASMGLAYTHQMRADEAVAAYVEALRLGYTPSQAHIKMGYHMLGQNNLLAAEQEFRLSTKFNPYALSGYIGLGTALMLQGENEEALTNLEHALTLDSDNTRAQNILGAIKVLEGDMDGAIEVLTLVLEEEPEDVLALNHLGIAYLDKGEFTKAKEALKTYQALAAEDMVANKARQLDYLLKALEQGYTLSEERAIEQIEEYVGSFFDNLEISVEDIEGEGRTLVMTLPDVDIADDQQMLMRDIGILAGVSALVTPQIDPVVSNGLLIKVQRYGKILYTASTTLEDLKQYGYGLVEADKFVTSLEVTRFLNSGQGATLREIEQDVAEIRELDLDQTIASEVISREQLGERLSEDEDEHTVEADNADDTLLTLLGVIEPDVDLSQLLVDLHTEQVSGFYVPEEDKFYLLETEEQTAAGQMTIAHEYVHALQDFNLGLGALDEGQSDDARLAFRALVEGDAMLTMLLYAEQHITAMDLLKAIVSVGGLEQDKLEESPAFIQEVTQFPYTSGLEFIIALYSRGGWEEVNAAFENPPQSTEQILHPSAYWEEDEPHSVSIPSFSGWEAMDEQVFGELGLRLALATHVGPTAAGLACEGWGGDSYVVLQNSSTDANALVIKTLWDDAEEAEEFWQILRLMLEQQLEYEEDVRVLTGEVEEHWWQGETQWVYAMSTHDAITFVFGPDEATIQELVEQLQ